MEPVRSGVENAAYYFPYNGPDKVEVSGKRNNGWEAGPTGSDRVLNLTIVVFMQLLPYVMPV